MPERTLVEYPFPFGNVVCQLWLPKDGLSEEEAVRLSAFIDTLVVRKAQPDA